MYRVEVVCNAGMPFGDCGGYAGGWWTTDNPAEPMPTEFRNSLAEAGWVEADGKHYCPRHDPAKQGVLVSVGRDYVELAPGVRARWRGAERAGDFMPIEVQCDVPATGAQS
jgi:hypothetical protein